MQKCLDANTIIAEDPAAKPSMPSVKIGSI